jgi:predicted phosphoribosyltransferase
MAAEIEEDEALRDRTRVFADRRHAGELLAARLGAYRRAEALVLAIPAGGIPVGAVLSQRLSLPLDLLLVRKIPIPYEPEAGMGAVSWDGRVFLNDPLLDRLGLTEEEVEEAVRRAREGLEARSQRLRGGKPFPPLSRRPLLVVDDGVASGYTMLASLKSLQRYRPREVVVAVPTGSPRALHLLASNADRVLCLNVRTGPFFAVADAYERWYDLSEEEALHLLREVGYRP